MYWIRSVRKRGKPDVHTHYWAVYRAKAIELAKGLAAKQPDRLIEVIGPDNSCVWFSESAADTLPNTNPR